jgi:hypothetical protein
MKKLNFYLLSLLFVLSTACDNTLTQSDSEAKVELYLIETYTKHEKSLQIVESSVVTQQQPLIAYNDIVSYNSSDNKFELSKKAIETIKNLQTPINGLPFAIKANNEIVYTGYFWPSVSSAICDCIVIDPMMLYAGNKIHVQLGYPGLFEHMKIDDKRNDTRIISILKKDRKLKR